MNERIKQLAEQAFKGLGTNPVYATAMIYASKELEKFAELLIKECIGVPYAMWDKAELNADIAVKIEHRIKDHFGVEQ